ncbi:MAG TPA: EAL domain-containing protein [Solirubrobacterales bacterium]|nr:EAL domain-containing protein [Solirubrobacterales bacterium]
MGTPLRVRLARHDLLGAAAVGLAMLWLCVVALAATGIKGAPLLGLGALGLVGTVALLPGAHRRQVRRLRGLAATDALTGLTNHRGFQEALARELERARRDDRPMSLVMLDLDNFKTVNDTHGHPYGDEVLRSVGAALAGVVRSTDTAARVGGEEFALILTGIDGEVAYGIAERAREAIGEVSVEGVVLSCSAGIASYPADADDASRLCKFADGALYWAKRQGKQRTRRFDPEHVASASDQQAVEIAAMIAEPDGIRPVFQPVVDLASGHLVGYEALARFKRLPGRSPEAWFAAAHSCGLGPEFDAAAIRAALGPVGRPIGTHLALNVSPSTLTSDAVAEVLPADLSGIVIEITEHEFVPDDETLSGAVAKARDRGAQIALDDAGAGYAGLKQMMRVKPDIVKLDRDLIKRIHADPARMALVESFVRFARRIGATVCAEGIESLDDLEVVASLDVQWGQGYALCRPEAPWAMVSPIAAGVCRTALAEALRAGSAGSGRIAAGDRRLEHLSTRLASAHSRRDLEGVMALIAAELNADMVCLSQWHPEREVVETLAESGGAPEESFTLEEYPLTAHVLRDQQAVQVLVGDPEADRREVELLLSLGHRSLLMVPVVSQGESLGIVEAYSRLERPWTRTEINHARIISNQFGSVIMALFRAPANVAS